MHELRSFGIDHRDAKPGQVFKLHVWDSYGRINVKRGKPEKQQRLPNISSFWREPCSINNYLTNIFHKQELCQVPRIQKGTAQSTFQGDFPEEMMIELSHEEQMTGKEVGCKIRRRLSSCNFVKFFMPCHSQLYFSFHTNGLSFLKPHPAFQGQRMALVC